MPDRPAISPSLHEVRRWRGDRDAVIVGDEWGSVDGPLVVLLHGGGQTRHSWKLAGATLAAAGYRVAAFDTRGHGDSSWADDGDYRPETLVKDLVAVCEQIGDDSPVLVGASVGGGTALTAIGEGWIGSSALVLVDVAPRVEALGAAKVFEFMLSRPDGFASLDEAADAIAEYQSHRTRSASTTGLAKNVRLGIDGRYRWHWDPRFMADKRDLATRQRQQERCARALTVPTMLIRGAMSDVVSLEGVQEFLACCPHAEFADVKDASHMVVGDHNDIFLSTLTEFLGRNVPPSATQGLIERSKIDKQRSSK